MPSPSAQRYRAEILCGHNSEAREQFPRKEICVLLCAWREMPGVVILEITW